MQVPYYRETRYFYLLNLNINYIVTEKFRYERFKNSSRKFESSHREHSEMEEPPNDFSEVSNGEFESSQSKDRKIDGRSRSRTTSQINSYIRFNGKMGTNCLSKYITTATVC